MIFENDQNTNYLTVTPCRASWLLRSFLTYRPAGRPADRPADRPANGRPLGRPITSYYYIIRFGDTKVIFVDVMGTANPASGIVIFGNCL